MLNRAAFGHAQSSTTNPSAAAAALSSRPNAELERLRLIKLIRRSYLVSNVEAAPQRRRSCRFLMTTQR